MSEGLGGFSIVEEVGTAVDKGVVEVVVDSIVGKEVVDIMAVGKVIETACSL